MWAVFYPTRFNKGLSIIGSLLKGLAVSLIVLGSIAYAFGPTPEEAKIERETDMCMRFKSTLAERNIDWTPKHYMYSHCKQYIDID